MSILIREADLYHDGPKIALALSKYLTPHADAGRFEWLYKQNPSGKVRAWLALDHETVIASGAVFPRRAYMNKMEITAWVLGDFCVSSDYRVLGPAVTLQRALLQASHGANVAISYDFPSLTMTAVYKRLKIEPLTEMIRMAKMLRVDRKLREQIRPGWVSNAAAPIGNVVMRASSLFHPKVDKTITISPLRGKCGSAFDILAERVGPCFDFCVRRSADYLNWRYLANPYKKHELISADRNGVLFGFAVISQNGADGEIVDIFGENDGAIIGRLIHEVVELFRQRGVVTVSAELSESHPWLALFKQFGFYPRERKPFMMYSPNKARDLRPVGHSSWFITGGDRDS